MLNIEKHLDNIQISHKNPSPKLIDDTIFEIHKLSGKKGFNLNWLINIKTMMALTASVATLLVMFMMSGLNTSSVHAFYSVDINPSVIISVNSDEEVVGIEGMNDEAALIIKEVDVIGLSSKEAISLIIKAAASQGYINDSNKYVLIGRFGEGNDQVVPNMQEYFEDNFNEMVQVLLVTGTIEDKERADELEVSPGLLELSVQVKAKTPEVEDKVETVLEEADEKQVELLGVNVNLTDVDGEHVFKFNKLSFNDNGYEGNITFKLVKAVSKEKLESYDFEVVIHDSYFSTEELPQSLTIKDLEGGHFYAMVVEYEGGIKKISNSVYLAKEKIKDETTKVLEGSNLSEEIKLSWTKASGASFKSYKVVASKTNSSPSYPNDGHLLQITDVNQTSIIIDPNDYELEEGITYYFAITYLYDGDKQTTNAVSLITFKEEQKVEEEEKIVSLANIISASLNGEVVSISWNKVNQENFSGYKVVYSFKDSTPKYDEEYSHSVEYISDINQTSSSFNLKQALKNNHNNSSVVYVSITATYDDFNTKLAGDVKTFTIPDNLITKEEEKENQEFVATDITEHSLNGDNVFLKWNVLDIDGFEGYKVVYSFTDSTPKYGEGGTHYKQWITNKYSNSTTINLHDIISKNTTGSEFVYFSITALYDDHAVKLPGNVIKYELPEELTEEEKEQGLPSNLTSATIDGNTIYLSWEKMEQSHFEGYKVMYSFTDSNPVYGTSGHYLRWITDKNATTLVFDYDDIKGENTSGSEVVYFSITALYDNHNQKIAGNSKSVAVPVVEEVEQGLPSNLTSATIEGDTVSLSWEKMEQSHFEGYKVMYSFTDSNPVYGTSGHYVRWITDRNTTSLTFNFDEIKDKNTSDSNVVYFSVTALYDNHSQKIAGNTKTVSVPVEEVEEERVGTSVSASLNEGVVSINFDAITHEQLEGYKIVYSFTNSNPVHDGEQTTTLEYISKGGSTSYSFNYDQIKGNRPEGAQSLYVSVSAYYNDGQVIKGNAVKIGDLPE